MLFPFPVLSISPLTPPPPLLWVFPLPIHPFLLPLPQSPTLWGPTLARPRVSPSIGAQQGHPLLHMQLEPWVSLWVGSGLVPGSSGWLPLLFLWGRKPLKFFQSFLKILQWGSHSQFSGLLLAFASVFDMFWLSLSLSLSLRRDSNNLIKKITWRRNWAFVFQLILNVGKLTAKISHCIACCFSYCAPLLKGSKPGEQYVLQIPVLLVFFFCCCCLFFGLFFWSLIKVLPLHDPL